MLRYNAHFVRMLIGGVLVAVSTGSCDDGDGGGVSGSTEPTAPAYITFDLRHRDREFAVLYDTRYGGARGDLLWRKSDRSERWDAFLRYGRTGTLGGDTTLLRDGRPAGGCWWDFLEAESVEMRCALGGDLSVPAETLFREGLSALGSSFVFSEHREIIGLSTTCFETASSPYWYAEACFSDDGLLLFLEIRYNIWGPITIEAKAVLDDSALASISDLPWSDGEPPPIAIRDQILFPPIPSLEAFLDRNAEPQF